VGLYGFENGPRGYLPTIGYAVPSSEFALHERMTGTTGSLVYSAFQSGWAQCVIILHKLKTAIFK
jgi:hypothetical protein